MEISPTLALLAIFSYTVFLRALLTFQHPEVHVHASAGVFAENHPEAIPSFLIIGTAKGGTTDLFEQLANQEVNAPGTRPDPPITRHFRNKEVGFLLQPVLLQEALLGKTQFQRYLQGLGHPCANLSSSAAPIVLPSWTGATHPVTTSAAAASLAAGTAKAHKLHECVRAASARELTIDATPTYLNSPLAPHLLSVVSPHSKVILMLRDPVDRVQSLYNHFLVEDGRWRTRRLDALVDDFLAHVNNTPAVSETLDRLAACAQSDTGCHEDGWRDLVGLGLLDFPDTALFAGGLYRYILAPWRLHYFRPHRVMLIDSHAYFADRTAVMDQVVRFLYGRPLTAVERRTATYGQAVCVKRHNTTVPSVDKGTLGVAGRRLGTRSSTSKKKQQMVAGAVAAAAALRARRKAGQVVAAGAGAGASIVVNTQLQHKPPSGVVESSDPAWVLSPEHHKRLTAFYERHVTRGLREMVEEMRQEGAWVVGFDGPPWPEMDHRRKLLLPLAEEAPVPVLGSGGGGRPDTRKSRRL